MKWTVLIAHAKGEDDFAERLASPLRDAGYAEKCTVALRASGNCADVAPSSRLRGPCLHSRGAGGRLSRAGLHRRLPDIERQSVDHGLIAREPAAG